MLSDVSAIVFGGAGGIGKAFCEQVIEAGGKVFLIGRNEEKLHQVASEYSCEYAVCDGRDIEAVGESYERAAERLGKVNAAVNLIGSVLLKPAHLISADEWNDTLQTNLTSAFAVTRAVARHASEPTSVVLMSTAAAGLGLANHEAISAAKKGVEGLAQAAAASYSSKGLRFNVVAPGLTETPLTARITSNEKARKMSESMHPLGRIGKPQDIASAIAWLVDPVNSWVTAQTIAVDGGLSTIKAK